MATAQKEIPKAERGKTVPESIAKGGIDIAHAAILFVQNNGFREIKALSPEQMAAVIKSDGLYSAIHNPDRLNADKKGQLAENLKELARDKKFMASFRRAYGDADGMKVRWLLGEIYNSEVGREVMKSVMNLESATMLPRFAKLMYTVITANLKMTEDEMQKSFEHFKYNEQNIALDAEGRMYLMILLQSIENNDKMAWETLCRRFNEKPGVVADIFRTQDIRDYMKKSIGDKDKRKRIKEVFLSDEGRAMLDRALDTPEGINLLGCLFNTKGGRAFVWEIITNINVIDSFKTIKLIMDKQARMSKMHKTL
jgi:hypothetical protein